MTKAKLVIFRHGETEYNKQSLMTGQREVPLTKRGEEQAREAGKMLRGIRFDKVYSSNLSRAFNTAALALEASKKQKHLKTGAGSWNIEQRCEIIEMHTGDFTGRNHKTDPEIVNWKRLYNVPLPNGESDKQVVARVQKFFDDEVLPRLLKGENVLVVVHSGVVHAFDIVLGVEPVPADNGSVMKKTIPNAAPSVHSYEDGVRKSSSFLANPKAAGNQNAPPQKPKKRLPWL